VPGGLPLEERTRRVGENRVPERKEEQAARSTSEIEKEKPGELLGGVKPGRSSCRS
jgi:hypothetical protein